MKKKRCKKKKQMNVFLSNQTYWSGYYTLFWGLDGTTDMNKKSHGQRFRKYKTAIAAKNKLVNKFKRQGYKVRYTYAAD